MKAIFFDLDGTLLPMDEGLFTQSYFKLLCKKAAPLGYQPEQLVNGIWAGTAAMVSNDGSKTNEQAFWEKFTSIFGQKSIKDNEVFLDFYKNEFSQAKAFTSPNPELVRQIIDLAHQKYDMVVLATNPIFPSVGTENRMSWVGLSKEDFDYITAYENSSYCKPNPKYFEEIMDKLNLKPEDCFMIGNDVFEDGYAASQLGIDCYLVTDCLVNKKQLPIEVAHGNLASVIELLNQK